MNAPPYPNPDSRMPVLFDPMTGKFVLSLATPVPSVIPGGAPKLIAGVQFSGKTLEEAVGKYRTYVEQNKAAEQERQRAARAALAAARKAAIDAQKDAQNADAAQQRALNANAKAKKNLKEQAETKKSKNKAAKNARNSLKRSCGWSKGIFGWSKPTNPSNDPECAGLE